MHSLRNVDFGGGLLRNTHTTQNSQPKADIGGGNDTKTRVKVCHSFRQTKKKKERCGGPWACNTNSQKKKTFPTPFISGGGARRELGAGKIKDEKKTNHEKKEKKHQTTTQPQPHGITGEAMGQTGEKNRTLSALF